MSRTSVIPEGKVMVSAGAVPAHSESSKVKTTEILIRYSR
jgi:hypothetical protein